jgi:raffinose/stachyose/melibiose transport system substrate-binding protein
MNVTGTWVVQDLGREAKFDLGVFMLPPVGKDVKPGTLWGEGSQWQIAASAAPEVRDAAAAYLNCLVGPDKRKTWIEKGYLVPIGSSVEEIQNADTLPVVKEFYAKGLATTADNFYDLHTTLPESVTQVLYAELQKLAGGEETADAFLSQMQAAWSAAVKNGERWVP